MAYEPYSLNPKKPYALNPFRVLFVLKVVPSTTKSSTGHHENNWPHPCGGKPSVPDVSNRSTRLGLGFRVYGLNPKP